MNSLYALTDELLDILDDIDRWQQENDSTETPAELLQSYELVGELRQDKLKQIWYLMRNTQAELHMLAEEKRYFERRRKTAENRLLSLRAYVEENMKALGEKKFQHDEARFAIQRNPPSVHLFDEPALPADVIQIERKPMRAEIARRLLAGEDVPGAELLQSESLRIR